MTVLTQYERTLFFRVFNIVFHKIPMGIHARLHINFGVIRVIFGIFVSVEVEGTLVVYGTRISALNPLGRVDEVFTPARLVTKRPNNYGRTVFLNFYVTLLSIGKRLVEKLNIRYVAKLRVKVGL